MYQWTYRRVSWGVLKCNLSGGEPYLLSHVVIGSRCSVYVCLCLSYFVSQCVGGPLWSVARSCDTCGNGAGERELWHQTPAGGAMKVSSPHRLQMERETWQMKCGCFVLIQPGVNADTTWMDCYWSHIWVLHPAPACIFWICHLTVDGNHMWDWMWLLRLDKKLSKPPNKEINWGPQSYTIS